MIDQRLTNSYQLFSWTSVQPSNCWIDKMIGLQGHLNVRAVPRVASVPAKNSFTEMFSKWKNFQTKDSRKFYSPCSKISLHYETVIYHKLTVFHQLFSWTSVGLSKCPINKMIVWQVHLNVWAVHWVQHGHIQTLLQTNSFQMNQFPNLP